MNSTARTYAGTWEIRRATLTRLLRKACPGVLLSEHLDGDGETIFRHACALGAEGIVAKRRDRPYRSGRCPDWGEGEEPGRAGSNAHHGMGVIGQPFDATTNAAKRGSFK